MILKTIGLTNILTMLIILLLIVGWLLIILKIKYNNKYKDLLNIIKKLIDNNKSIFKKIKFKK